MGTFRERLHALIAHVLADFQKPIVNEFPGTFDAAEIKVRVINAVIQTVQATLAQNGSAPDISTLPETHIHVTQLASQPWCKVEFSPEFEERIDAFDRPKSDEPDIIARIEAILTRLDTHLNKLDRLFPKTKFSPAPPKVVHHIYLAGPWDARNTINAVADLLRGEGHNIVSKWHEPRFDGRDGTFGVFHDKKDVEAYEMNGKAIDIASAMVVFPDIGTEGGRETWFEVARFLNGDFSSPRGRRLYVFTSKVLPLTLRVTKHPMTVILDEGGEYAVYKYSRALLEAFRIDEYIAAGVVMIQDRRTAVAYIEKMLRDICTSRFNVMRVQPNTSIFSVMQQLANGLASIDMLQVALSAARHAKDDQAATAVLNRAIEHRNDEEHKKDALAILYRWMEEIADIQLAIRIAFTKPGSSYFSKKELAMFMALPTDVRKNLVASLHPAWRSNERRCECRSPSSLRHFPRLGPDDRQYMIGPLDRLMVQPHRCLHCTGIVENARAVPNSTIFDG